MDRESDDEEDKANTEHLQFKAPIPPNSPPTPSHNEFIPNPTLLNVDAFILGRRVTPYLRQLEWIHFASVCKHTLISFEHYLYGAAQSTNVYAKHVPMRALRQYIMRKSTYYYPLQLLQTLKNYGARVSADSLECMSKLKKSVLDDDILAVKVLLDFGANAQGLISDIMNRYSDYGLSESMLKLLFLQISDLNELNENGHPIALQCIFNGQLNELKVLIKYFSDKVDWKFKTSDLYHRNLAFWATVQRDDDLYLEFLTCLWQTKQVDMTLADSYGVNGAILAIKHDRFDALMFLIEHCNCDVNTKDIFGNTLLHVCCDRGRPHMLDYLISKGANFKLANKYGQLPMDIAVMYNRAHCVVMLKLKEHENDDV